MRLAPALELPPNVQCQIETFRYNAHGNCIAEPTSTENVRAPASFRNPPLQEVALAVQFESLVGFTSAHVGLFWQQLSDRFPRIEEHFPLSPMPIERAGSVQTDFQLEVSHGPARTRAWLVDASNRELLQIQSDRLVRNWRKAGDTDAYPRYETHIRPHFKEDYSRFVAFVESHDLGKIQPLQCEVAYFNQIRTNPATWDSLREMYKVTSTYQPPNLDDLPLIHESSQLRQVFSINESDTHGIEPLVGRLYTEIIPVETNGQPILRFHLTARGRPRQPTTEGVMDFLDLGRRTIVQCFDRSTTAEMHEVWGKEN